MIQAEDRNSNDLEQPTTYKRLCLIVIDGYGISPDKNEGDATKTVNFLPESNYLQFELMAHGEFVGLPPGFMGNSEVGHMTIGAGRTVQQPLSRINTAIKEGVFSNKVTSLSRGIHERIHLIGLVSDGGVHSHIQHLQALYNSIPQGIPVSIHAIADGRDTEPACLLRFLKELPPVASISGRYFAMDRDGNEERTERTFRMLTEGVPSVLDIDKLYKEGITDEFIEPTLIRNEHIKENDILIFFNFRADRMRQLVSRFKDYKNKYTLSDYGDEQCIAIFDKTVIHNTLAEWISKHRITQTHIAESEKYAHVTYFFNGGVEKSFPGEERVVVKSPSVGNFDECPETAMSEVGKCVIKAMKEKRGFVLANLAGPDLVGHTGNLEATKEAVRKAWEVINEIISESVQLEYTVVITADHGNAERMIYKGKQCKTHTENKVPMFIVNSGRRVLKTQGTLADVSPTILDLMGLAAPHEMTGESLLES